MKRVALICALLFGTLALAQGVKARLTPFSSKDATQIELKNDTWNPTGGAAYLEQGFVTGEKAGIWVQVPASVPQFVTDNFRVLINGGASGSQVQVYFSMATSANGQYAVAVPEELTNVAQLTVGNYWNDIPAQGASGASPLSALPCMKAGDLIGAAIEFTQDGLPSVYRDGGPLNAPANLIFGIPGGWNLSQVYGVQGNWILRIVGHQAAAGECQ